MKIEARKLCGDHVGRDILVHVPQHTSHSKDPDTGRYEFFEVPAQDMWLPVAMITHKKDGTVNVRVSQREHRFTADAIVDVEGEE